MTYEVILLQLNAVVNILRPFLGIHRRMLKVPTAYSSDLHFLGTIIQLSVLSPKIQDLQNFHTYWRPSFDSII